MIEIDTTDSERAYGELSLAVPERSMDLAIKLLPPENYQADFQYRDDVALLAAPLLASQYRAQGFAMIKGLDPSGTWWTPTLRCVRHLFDAATALDGIVDPDEPPAEEAPETPSTTGVSSTSASSEALDGQNGGN